MRDLESLQEIVKGILPLDEQAMAEGGEVQKTLLKPFGSLGMLEEITLQMAGITGQVHNDISKRVLFQFGADNGIHAEGVASGEQALTNTLMSGYGRDNGSAVNVLCRRHHVDLKLIDIGIIGPMDYSLIDNRNLMEGTNNFAVEPAIPPETALKSILVGIDYVAWAKEEGYQIVGTGEIGIGNTTTAAACILAALPQQHPEDYIGLGAGLTPAAHQKKIETIINALEFHHPKPSDPLEILSTVGGLDIGGLVGVFLGAAYYRLPVVVDGVITMAAALLANLFNPLVTQFMFPSHLSEEPAFQLAASHLKLQPYLNLRLRLGEGAACTLAMDIIDNALLTINTMGTFKAMSPNADYRMRALGLEE